MDVRGGAGLRIAAMERSKHLRFAMTAQERGKAFAWTTVAGFKLAATGWRREARFATTETPTTAPSFATHRVREVIRLYAGMVLPNAGRFAMTGQERGKGFAWTTVPGFNFAEMERSTGPNSAIPVWIFVVIQPATARQT